MSQRSHIAISGSTAIWPCSAACSEPWSTSSGNSSRTSESGQLVPERLRHELLLGQVDRQQVEHGVVRHVLLLVRDHLLGHRHDPERERHAAALALVAHLLDPGLGLLLRLRVPVAVEGPHERAPLLQVELLHLERRAHVQVDRAGVDGGVRPRGLHVADHLAALGLHDRHRVRRGRAQRDSRRRIAGPARQVAPAALAQRALLHEPARVLLPARAEHLAVLGRERQLVGGGGEVRARGSARTRGRGSPAPPAARGTRWGGGRRTGRARPRPPRTWPGRGCGVRRGPTSGAGSPPCRGRSRRAPRRGRRRRCRARARWWPPPPAGRPRTGAARSRAAAPACSRRGRARCARRGRAGPRPRGAGARSAGSAPRRGATSGSRSSGSRARPARRAGSRPRTAPRRAGRAARPRAAGSTSRSGARPAGRRRGPRAAPPRP